MFSDYIVQILSNNLPIRIQNGIEEAKLLTAWWIREADGVAVGKDNQENENSN